MTWQKVARAVVAVVGIGSAIAVYLMIRPQPTEDAGASTALLPGDVTATGADSKFKVVDASGAVIYELWAAVQKTLSDGREQFENVRITFPHAGTTQTVVADRAEKSGVAGPTGEQPSIIVFEGHVTMTDGTGFSVSTESATYLEQEQRITFPGALSFTRGQLAGKGHGGDLYMDKSVIWLYDQAEMVVTPEDGGTSVVATGERIGLADADHYLRIEEGAKLTREDQELTSDLMMVYFVEGSRALRRIDMEGHANVEQVAGAGGGSRSERPDMHADTINLDFAAETGTLSHAQLQEQAVLTLREARGQTRVAGKVIELNLAADGTTLTRLTATGGADVQLPRDGTTPARSITAPDLLAEGPESTGLDRAVFRGGVSYTEGERDGRGRLVPRRTASSTSLALGLGGSLNDVTLAQFRQNFKVTDDGLTAVADEGHYDATKETLELRATVPNTIRPKVVTEEIEVSGNEIDVDLNADGIDARGGVQSTRKIGKETAASESQAGLFESGKPVSGKADSLVYSKTTGVAVYAGAVTLLQDAGDGTQGNVLRADTVRLDEKNEDITADGHVRSKFPLTQQSGAEAAASPVQTELKSDAMKYTASSRTSVYTGHATMDSANGEHLEGEKISIFLLPDRRELKGLEAVAAPGDLVRATLADDRRVSGLTLTYDAKADRYVVTGAPATLISRAPARGPDACDVGTGSILRFLRTKETADVESEGGAVAKTENKKCSEVIK